MAHGKRLSGAATLPARDARQPAAAPSAGANTAAARLTNEADPWALLQQIGLPR